MVGAELSVIGDELSLRGPVEGKALLSVGKVETVLLLGTMVFKSGLIDGRNEDCLLGLSM